jgi:hypothetical protein
MDNIYCDLADKLTTLTVGHPALINNRAHLISQLRRAAHKPSDSQNLTLLAGVKFLLGDYDAASQEAT